MIDDPFTKFYNKEITLEELLKCTMWTRFESVTECNEFLAHYNIPNISDGFSDVVDDKFIEVYFRRGKWECMIKQSDPISDDESMYLALKWGFHFNS